MKNVCTHWYWRWRRMDWIGDRIGGYDEHMHQREPTTANGNACAREPNVENVQ